MRLFGLDVCQVALHQLIIVLLTHQGVLIDLLNVVYLLIPQIIILTPQLPLHLLHLFPQQPIHLTLFLQLGHHPIQDLLPNQLLLLSLQLPILSHQLFLSPLQFIHPLLKSTNTPLVVPDQCREFTDSICLTFSPLALHLQQPLCLVHPRLSLQQPLIRTL